MNERQRLVDIAHMREALALAARGRTTVSPNPMVGCVIVAPDGACVGRGAHERAGEAHAEVHALRDAGARARGATMYVTLEPCCHTGRTGPCVVPTVDAGIARVVAAVEDPNPLVAGQGFAFLRQRGVEVTVGVLEAEARRLNEAFFTSVTLRRPHVTLKVALSADGFIAKAGGGPTAISGRESLKHAHVYRSHVDGLAVGIGTLLADDPRLTVRGAYRSRPLMRVIFDSGLRTPLSARIWQTRVAGPIVIVTTEAAVAARPDVVAAVAERGGECVACAPHDVADALAALDRRQVRSVVLEGGALMHQAAWNAGVVDRVHLYQSPRRLGNGVRWTLDGLRDLAAWPDADRQSLGPDTLIDIDVHRTR